MDECTPFFNQMADLRERLLDDEEQKALFAHLAHCAICRDLLEFHEDLSGAGTEFDGPSDEALAAVRRGVIAEIGRDSTTHRPTVVAMPRPFWRRPQVLAAAASVLVLLSGVTLGRLIGGRPVSESDLLIAALENSATQNLRLQDVENSSTLISNVAVRPLDDGRVALAFDVARHLEIQRYENDPLVNEVLVHAMLDQTSLGSRLKAVSLASTASNGKVQEALIFAMINDPDLPVRLRALEILTTSPFGDAVEDGLFHVLQRDDSMQMRLLAVELLAQRGSSQERLLEEMGAGDGTFEPALTEAMLQINKS
ncbi:MAG: hypothetical protein GY906_34085 [bacterium]|nr:hypothetical protein [bacterium]